MKEGVHQNRCISKPEVTCPKLKIRSAHFPNVHLKKLGYKSVAFRSVACDTSSKDKSVTEFNSFQ